MGLPDHYEFMKLNMNIWGGFLVSTIALLLGILLMDVYRHTMFFYILIAMYVTCSSLGSAMTFRDRLASRIYRCYLSDAKRAGDKITTYIMTNILRAFKASEFGGFVFTIIMVVSLFFTVLALLTPSEGDDSNNPVPFWDIAAIGARVTTPGFWMVLVCIIFSFVALHVLAEFTQVRKQDEIDLNDEFILGWFGGMFPVIGIFVVAIVLAFVGVLTMGIGFTEKGAIIVGVVVFVDATFNKYKFARRDLDADKLWLHWDRRYGAGEKHMKIDPIQILGRVPRHH